MAVTRVHLADRDQYLEQIDRLVSSHVLHGSESLCKLLRYLAMHALTHPGVPLKEYEIATEVFHRPADFDPQLDSTIRVQAGRLRLKLAEYYGSEGAEDPILVNLPKGGYVLGFHHRTEGAQKGLSVAPLGITRHESTGAPRTSSQLGDSCHCASSSAGCRGRSDRNHDRQPNERARNCQHPRRTRRRRISNILGKFHLGPGRTLGDF